MKRSRFSDEQIIGILKAQEAGALTADVCRRHGISEATFYKCKAKFGGLEVTEAKRLRTLEEEYAKLKKLLDEAMLDIAVLKDISSKNGDARRDAVAHARGCYGLSYRGACHLIGIARRVARYQPRVADDTGLRQRRLELAAVRRRFGYRRLG
jgi:putative transposase